VSATTGHGRTMVRRATRCARSATWITNWNDNPKQFVWHKSADQILDSLAAYCQRINDSGHWRPGWRRLTQVGGSFPSHESGRQRGEPRRSRREER
jgi:hypothetical protein